MADPTHFNGFLTNFHRLELRDRNGVRVSKQKLDALLERMNQGEDIEQGMDLLIQLRKYLPTNP